MQEKVSRIAEMIRAKIMAGDVKPTTEGPCGNCPLAGCCEMVRCSAKEGGQPA